MFTYVSSFSELSKKSVSVAGGKGANLGEMVQSGIPVPPGFVILAPAFERFLEETDIGVEIDAGLDRLNHRDLTSVDRFSHEIRDLIHDARFPGDLKKEVLQMFRKLRAPYVAVRSSATAEDSSIASWAGELETYLFITQQKLFGAVKSCWSSLFTPRAIFYRYERKLHKTKVSVAVVVQKMVNSQVSGVCFTAHPVTKDRKQMVIEAGFGLGEAIVSGMITPDTYIIDKEDEVILDVNVSTQEKMIIRKPGAGTKTVRLPRKLQDAQVLTGSQIVELARMCKRIEAHYRCPQDIEWAIEKKKIYITQTRPITTLLHGRE
ncbi:MAG: PEP/pyruvate-binding domain-containing protein [Patescibacteria group bacterium]|nr:PEP/pyruvate-binding domain-containing protein [Patescibacteria group bacterium]MDD5715470.1 PEP/pyruvate-binding domain-containing protein [Patescibacteria group bacterium]